jgi:general stress protein YciG
MDENKQREIARKGGKATGGKNLTTEARAKGGRNSHGGGRRSNS